MRKTLSISVVISLILLITGFYYFVPKSHSLPTYCAFCDSAIIKGQAFYEDDLVMGLYTHKPMLDGHCLIIPKRHVARFEHLTEEEMARMGTLIQKVNAASEKIWNTSSYLLMQKNGVEVGQTVPHVHFHYIPRKQGDTSVVGFLVKMFLAAAGKPISPEVMQNTVEKLKQEVSNYGCNIINTSSGGIHTHPTCSDSLGGCTNSS